MIREIVENINEAKEKFFLLTWFKWNDEDEDYTDMNGSLNIVGVKDSKSKVTKDHQNDYKSNNKLQVEEISAKEAESSYSDEDWYIDNTQKIYKF